MTKSRKLQAIILGIFDKRQHNRQYMRLIWQYLPGRKLKELYRVYFEYKYGFPYLITTNMAKYGHLYIMQYFKQKGFIYNEEEANCAAQYGHLHIIQYLREHNIHCTYNGANWAADNKHWHVVLDLYKNGILPTKPAHIQWLFNYKENEIMRLKKEIEMLKNR